LSFSLLSIVYIADRYFGDVVFAVERAHGKNKRHSVRRLFALCHPTGSGLARLCIRCFEKEEYPSCGPTKKKNPGGVIAGG
jgi:hypothetical protein